MQFITRWYLSELPKQLREQGIKRNWKQCCAKVKKLENKYREVTDVNGKTGQGRQLCKFYNKLHEILRHRPASVPSQESLPVYTLKQKRVKRKK